MDARHESKSGSGEMQKTKRGANRQRREASEGVAIDRMLGTDGVPFGPTFFLAHLRGLVRDRCPDPSEHLPEVMLRLADGEALVVCHVMALGPGWVAIAAVDGKGPGGAPRMRTEIVPYGAIVRVIVRRLPAREGPIGFEPGVEPRLLTSIAAQESPSSAEEAMIRLAAAPGSPRGEAV